MATRNGAAEAEAYPHAPCLTQRRPGLVMGPCIGEIDLNRCRNEEVIVKGNFGWVWPMWAGRPRIDRIVIREVKYQLEVNRCRNEEVIVKGNFGWVWPMWAGCPRIDRIVIRGVQYQLEVNRCRNEEITRGAPGLVMGPCIVEIDRIVIRKVQYQLEVNRCRNEEIIVKCNFGWVWSMWAGRPRIDRIVIREVQYQFEVNWCRNEEIQGSSAYSVGGDSGQDGRTDGQTAEINTISQRFSKSCIELTARGLYTNE
ncbi:hypothetical protein DPMN_094299 [Dreissena polymorpha]|uniref:Uncharacterized protein n=1 Tax=Dreissena polymorpha TaxID=45954 RepID=A0A9D4L4V9_DREPO|nr:hypothetical protein DPMN_094299 [Dreissena polymorpha]